MASHTPIAAIEKAAAFAEGAPAIANGMIDVEEARDAVAFAVAYSALCSEARVLLRRLELAILRRKLNPAKATRDLYRVTKIFAVNDADVQTHMEDLKRILVPRRKRPPAPPAEPTPAAHAVAPLFLPCLQQKNVLDRLPVFLSEAKDLRMRRGIVTATAGRHQRSFASLRTTGTPFYGHVGVVAIGRRSITAHSSG